MHGSISKLSHAVPKPQTTVARYSSAIITVGFAFALAFLARGYPIILCLTAVAATVWYGGIRPGVIAILLSILGLHYLPIPSFQPGIAHARNLVLFAAFALFLSWLIRSRRRAEGLLREARDELETKVAERTAELLQINERLKREVWERARAEERLRESEAYLSEAQRVAHVGTWVWQLPGRDTLYLSEEWYRIYGFNPDDGAPSWERRLTRIHPEDRAKWKGAIDRAMMDRTDYEVGFRILLPTGMVKYLHTVGHPVRDESGELVKFVGITRDVTERKRADEERERLHELESDLAHMNRVSMLGELAASLSHELKQPITAVITNANTALRWLKRYQPNIAEACAAVTRVVGDGHRAAEIIEHLRSFYKKGALPERELVDVNDILREMPALLRSEANRYSISVRTDLAAGLPRIRADRVQLQQVLLNLMLNGIEAMRDTAGELTIRSELGQDGLPLISVRDTGVGLPAEKTDQIFDAFFTTKLQGSGMGLAISRSIVESHGGRLWATSNSGPGATFHFTLAPAAEELAMPA